MHSWARTVAVGLFAVLALLHVQWLLSGDLSVLFELGPTGAAFGLLLVEKSAFVIERPDVSEDDSAVDIGS